MRSTDVSTISYEPWGAHKMHHLTGGGASIIISMAAIAGLVLSVMSALNVCNSACSDTSQYTIFGMHFGWFGV